VRVIGSGAGRGDELLLLQGVEEILKSKATELTWRGAKAFSSPTKTTMIFGGAPECCSKLVVHGRKVGRS